MLIISFNSEMDTDTPDSKTSSTLIYKGTQKCMIIHKIMVIGLWLVIPEWISLKLVLVVA
jgi:hypothetical protein